MFRPGGFSIGLCASRWIRSVLVCCRLPSMGPRSIVHFPDCFVDSWLAFWVHCTLSAISFFRCIFRSGNLSNNRRISLLCCLSLFAVLSLVCFAVGFHCLALQITASLPWLIVILLCSFFVLLSHCCYAPVTVSTSRKLQFRVAGCCPEATRTPIKLWSASG